MMLLPGMLNFAPVIVPTLSRASKLKLCLTSLSRCLGADQTHVIVSVDGLTSPSLHAGRLEILEFLTWLDKQKCFKKLVVIDNLKNLGVHGNSMMVKQRAFLESDRFIYSEDDNEFSVDFLLFMNSALSVYESRDDVFSICGYGYPVQPKVLIGDYFLSKNFCAWGWGSWKNKFEKMKWSYSDFQENIAVLRRDRVAIPFRHLRSDIRKNVSRKAATGDTMICVHQLRYRMFSVFPAVSRVRNHGHDGGGQNCGFSPLHGIFSEQPISAGVSAIIFDRQVNWHERNEDHLKWFFSRRYRLIQLLLKGRVTAYALHKIGVDLGPFLRGLRALRLSLVSALSTRKVDGDH
jgi:hypothetical protein